VETLVLSHPNADHLNGLLYIADHFHVDQLWTNGETAETAGYDCLMETARKEAIRVPAYPELRRAVDPAEPMVEILYPPIGFLEQRFNKDWRRDENNNSLVLKITYDDISFLFPGDIGGPAETELIETAGERLRSTVLIAPHHGSRTSSSRAFLEAVDPEIIVISAGWKNRFHFPHPSVMKRYKEIGARIYRTDLNGAIWMETDGRNLVVSPTITEAKGNGMASGR
jgi:competence protein ComEC